MATFVGSAPLLFLFLNGSTSCLLGLGLMPEESRARFDLVSWFLAAAPLAVVVGAGSLLMFWALLRPGAVQVPSPA
jgi:di/tricarboxylate transporter